MKDDSPNTHLPKAICHRCGYNLRGAIESWQNSCPLAGTCPECGLEFEWIDIINPSRIKPMWCVEYARGRLGWVSSVFKTFALQLVPWQFWQRVRMQHEPRFRRIVIYLVLLVLTVYPVLMISQGWRAWTLYHVPPPLINPWPGTQMRPPPPPPPPPDAISDWEAVGWCMLVPFSSTSPGAHLSAWWQPFPAPLELLESAWYTGYWRGRPTMLSTFGSLAFFWVTLLIFMPLSFALLPQTRRTCKVRWSHIVRIGLYAFAFTVPMLWWAAMWKVPETVVAIMVMMCIVNIIWWGCACGRYLHLPRPWFVVSTLTVMLLLLGSAIQYYFMHETFVALTL